MKCDFCGTTENVKNVHIAKVCPVHEKELDESMAEAFNHDKDCPKCGAAMTYENAGSEPETNTYWYECSKCGHTIDD